MSQYELPILIKRWAQEAVTVEQTVGQILLYLDDVVERVKKLEQRAQSKQNDAVDSPSE